MSERADSIESQPDVQWGIFRGFLIGRVVCIAYALIAVGLIALLGRATRDASIVAMILLFDLSLTLPYYAMGKGHVARRRLLSATILVVEAALVTAGLYFLGETNAAYGLPLYTALSVMAAVVHSRRAGFAIAILCSLLFATLVISLGYNRYHHHRSAFSISFAEAWPWSGLVVNTFTCLGLAAVVGTSADAARALVRAEQIEASLREANSELEKRVALAVGALKSTNQTLAEKNASLEKALRHVELFARAVSHDLRNPVIAAAESLRIAENGDPRRRDRLVAIAAQNLGRADRMLVGLRDLMRTAGSARPTEPAILRTIVEEVIEEFESASAGKPFQLRRLGELSIACTQRESLAHVFRNLISNAIQHNGGRSELCVEVGQTGDIDDVTFFVRDNGMGIASEMQARIFEPFHRGSSSESDGLGLGLAIVEGIVADAGGEVWVESIPGQGATFRFTIPNWVVARRSG